MRRSDRPAGVPAPRGSPRRRRLGAAQEARPRHPAAPFQRARQCHRIQRHEFQGLLDPAQSRRRGRAQAARIGDEFRKHGIEVRLISSQYCRALDTAKLTKLGPVSRTPVSTRCSRQSAPCRPAPRPCVDEGRSGQLTMLVTHVDNIQAMAAPSSTPAKWPWCTRQGRRGRRRRQDHGPLTGAVLASPGWRRIGADAPAVAFWTMTDELPLAAEFPPASREDWLKLVRSALKDRPFERLTAKTYDGIPIEPLYGRAAQAQPDRGAPRPLGGAGARRSSRSGRGQRRGAARTGRTARPG